MSFSYKEQPVSGTGTATGTLTAIGEKELNGQLIIRAASGGDGIFICSATDTTGLLLNAGESVSLMIDSLSKVRVKRSGAVDVAYTYWAS